MIYNFDEINNRKNTSCVKYDSLEKYFGYKDLQPLWVADMDFKTPKEVSEIISQKASQGIYGYATPTTKTFSLIQNWMKKRHSWEVDTSNIVLVNGVVPAYSACIEAFSKQGDEIIVQTPVYFPLFKSIEENNRVLVTNPLKEKNGYYTMDLEDLKSKITPKTKMLALCSPHNPVGRLWSKEELQALAKICIENNIIIISDEIHADLVFKKFTPLASISKEISNITLTLNSPGKTFNTAGLNCAYAICENKELMNKFTKIAKKRELLSINVFGLCALEAAYEFGEKWLSELLVYLKSNITFTKKYLKDNSNIDFNKPEATYLLWLDFNNYSFTHEEINKKLLQNARVALNDGTSFGIEGNKYFRLNCALPQSELSLALSKIVTHFP